MSRCTVIYDIGAYQSRINLGLDRGYAEGGRLMGWPSGGVGGTTLTVSSFTQITSPTENRERIGSDVPIEQ